MHEAVFGRLWSDVMYLLYCIVCIVVPTYNLLVTGKKKCTEGCVSACFCTNDSNREKTSSEFSLTHSESTSEWGSICEKKY